MRHKIIPTNNNEKHSPFPCQSTTCLQERMKQTNIKKIHLVYSNLSSDNNKRMLVQQDKKSTWRSRDWNVRYMLPLLVHIHRMAEFLPFDFTTATL